MGLKFQEQSNSMDDDDGIYSGIKRQKFMDRPNLKMFVSKIREQVILVYPFSYCLRGNNSSSMLFDDYDMMAPHAVTKIFSN